MTSIGILVYDGFDLIDAGGPYEVFLTAARLQRRAGEAPGFDVTMVSPGGADVVAFGGMTLTSLVSPEDAGPFDVVVVPGTVDVGCRDCRHRPCVCGGGARRGSGRHDGGLHRLVPVGEGGRARRPTRHDALGGRGGPRPRAGGRCGGRRALGGHRVGGHQRWPHLRDPHGAACGGACGGRGPRARDRASPRHGLERHARAVSARAYRVIVTAMVPMRKSSPAEVTFNW
ncbi:hypothetical protein [Demequina litorisediminis]|uniref:hypothetical protein n=1 Tax=Demequina litorisediminis TaxID=1849022 RepID=UPI0024E15B6F|nr:hypothetical protein [Demequina litorisediminis]